MNKRSASGRREWVLVAKESPESGLDGEKTTIKSKEMIGGMKQASECVQLDGSGTVQREATFEKNSDQLVERDTITGAQEGEVLGNVYCFN